MDLADSREGGIFRSVRRGNLIVTAKEKRSARPRITLQMKGTLRGKKGVLEKGNNSVFVRKKKSEIELCSASKKS